MFMTLHMIGMRTEILRRRVQALEARAAAEAMA
jgi:heme exporter protein C